MGQRLVLTFHGIGQPPAEVGREELPYWCPEAIFHSILDALPRVSRECRIPIEIEFDDGNLSDFTIAAPALKERGLTAAFFVCAGRIGKAQYLTSGQMRELEDEGMTVGSHGFDHVDWRKLHDDTALDREVFQARDIITDVLGHPIEAVAIPFGSYDRRVWRTTAKGFTVIHTSDGGLAAQTGQVIPRETYSVEWEANPLQSLAWAAKPSFPRQRRSSLSALYKRNRNPPRSNV